MRKLGRRKRNKWVIGIDEVGRGPLAGPITVTAVATKSTRSLRGIRDSKKLSPRAREFWNNKIKRSENFLFSTNSVSASTIDKIGISTATRLAIARCLKKLNMPSAKIILDGNLYAPRIYKDQKTYIKGDERFSIISAASVVAKVSRDASMERLHNKYPKYGFARHKGYGTRFHRDAIKKYGLIRHHRKSFCSKII
jgi:ribonuclease HII